jgi:outer membrane protein assembly factor BamB
VLVYGPDVKSRPRESSFWRDAKTSTRDGRATRNSRRFQATATPVAGVAAGMGSASSVISMCGSRSGLDSALELFTLLAVMMKGLLHPGVLTVLSLNLVVVSQMFSQESQAPVADQSVAWQNNITHDGFDSASPLAPPLTLKWQKDLSSSGVTSISYPIIAQGLVIVTVTTSNQGESLLAFNEATGAQVWSADVSGTYGFANACYASGRVFVNNFDGLMKAFNAADGTPLWSVSLPNQYAFTSPPTAAGGIVYTGGAGIGGTVYAVDESNGNVLWTQSVENGDHSSPAIDHREVFVSYACPQSYAFAANNGRLRWHYSGGCEGGGGKTPVVYNGQVYVRDSYSTSTNGLVLDERTGSQVGEFDSDRPPAFVRRTGVYLQTGTLRGVDTTTGNVLWSFAGDGQLTSAPLIVRRTIYIGSSTGMLFALNTNGQQIWSTSVGASIPAPDEHNATLTTGLGAGDGLLVVPAGSLLAVYGN